MDELLTSIYLIFSIIITLEYFYDFKINPKKLYSFRDGIQSIYLASFFFVVYLSMKFLSLKLDPFLDQYLPRKEMNSVFNWILLTLGYDFLYYWMHRCEHKISLFWNASHIHHHSSRYLNFLVGFRSSVFQPIYGIPFLIPLYLIGFRTPEIYFMITLNKFYNFWVHTQHIGKIPLLDSILNTPSNHRVHHGRNPQYIDKNFGGIFILWDKWFGSFEPEGEKVNFGVHLDPEPLSLPEVMSMGFKKTNR